jgi:hypothetical protein
VKYAALIISALVSAVAGYLFWGPGAGVNRSGQPQVLQFQFEIGEQTVPVEISDRYFTVSSLPKPEKDVVRGFVVLIDDRSLEPSVSSAREDDQTIAIRYTAYVEGFIDKFLDRDHPNYYTKYSLEDQAYGLRRLSLAQRDDLAPDQQDRSFLLARRKGQDGAHDLLIECQQVVSRLAPPPCLMLAPLPNGVVREVTFNAGRIAAWREVEDATSRFSASIGIDGPPIAGR